MKILELCGAAALAVPLFLHEVKQEKRGEAGEEDSEGRKRRGEEVQSQFCDEPASCRGFRFTACGRQQRPIPAVI